MSNTRNGYMKLKAFLAENGIKQKEVAEMLDITQTSFSCKINRNGQDFTMDEVRKLCNEYNLDPNEIFLV